MGPTTPAAADGLPIKAEAPVFEVVQSGLDQAQAAELAKAAGIDARALNRNGAFSYVDAKTFARVPSLAGKQDLIPGRVTDVQLWPKKVGLFRGQCAEFCGLQHAHMALDVTVESEADFHNWLKAQQQSAQPARQPVGARAGSDAACRADGGIPRYDQR